ncbi:MAG: transglycosylase domain-containing protein [Saprospiraceae bacterium]|nr:transglycosylase domain-containing protein [Saprospiraceae bacterium]
MIFKSTAFIPRLIASSYKGLGTVEKIFRVGSLILILALFFIFIFTGMVRLGVFGSLPSIAEIKSIKNPVSSVLLDDNGKSFGKYFIENRTNVNYNSISPHIIQALIATEDQRFYQHHGIDIRSWARVLFKSILLSDQSSGGGSTISQQLAKNLYPRKDYWICTTPINKITEMMIALRLERTYNKEEILTWYLNTVPFGNSIFGIDVACKQLFNSDPEDINIEEAAVLVGMLKATGVYSPLRNEEKATERRNIVLGQMVKSEFISTAAYDSLIKLPIRLQYKKEGHTVGLGTYIREQIRLDLNRLLKDYQTPQGQPYNLYTDGLKIYTTLDAQMQRLAEDAVHERMTKLQTDFDRHWKKKDPWEQASFVSDLIPKTERYIGMKKEGSTEVEIESAFKQKRPMTIFTHAGEKDTLMTPLDSLKYYIKILNAGFVAMEQSSGKIKAWVGGVDYAHFKYDHVRSKRQVGSTFKPIVMAAALEEGYPPCDYFSNDHIVYSQYDNWEPQNSDNTYGGLYSMEGTLVHSVNCAAVDAIIQLGSKPVIDMAKRLGIQSSLPSVPSLALGTADISLMEMVQAFSVFPNKGMKNKPYYLRKIENNKGEVIVDFEKDLPPAENILSEVNAQLMTQMLKSVAESGTARSLKSAYSIGSEVGAKTGTTQNQSDGWLIGFTPKLTFGAWVGGEMPTIRFRSLDLGQGSYMALPICGSFLQKMNANKSLKKFQGGSFPALSDEAMSMLGCPYYIEEEYDETLVADNLAPADSMMTVPVSRHRVDTINNIKNRKRERRKDGGGIGGFLERLFKKKKSLSMQRDHR